MKLIALPVATTALHCLDAVFLKRFVDHKLHHCNKHEVFQNTVKLALTICIIIWYNM